MPKFIDLTGQTFGRLKVYNFLGKGKYLCKCSCSEGTLVIVHGGHLRSGHTTSCGCYAIDIRKKKWEPIEIDKNTYGIPLTKGQIALIDKEDFDKIKNYGWFAHYNKRDDVFHTYTNINNKHVIMHTLILNVSKGTEVDHIDHNTLNNRKTNLRLCSDSQNNMNRRITSRNTLGFKGVIKINEKYRAQIGVNNKTINLGTYNTAEEASRAYQEAAKKLHGNFYCNT